MSKKDNSIRVQQREKIKEELTIREFKWSEKQIELINLIKDKKSKLIFISGPAGTSKSLLSIYCGLQLLNNKRVGEIVYSRPILESAERDSRLGFLPGTEELKIEPYLSVVEEKLEELLPPSQISKLRADKRISFLPVNFARGRQVSNKCWVVDEAQGYCRNELVTLITRISEFSKVIICADPNQSDLPTNKQGGFLSLHDLFNDELSKENGIFTFEFTKNDILRSGLCKYIVEKLESANQKIVN